MNTTNTHSHPVVLITGTSSGIGLATAIQTAQAGWTTIATLRNRAKDDRLREAAATAGVTLDIRELDVTDPEATNALLHHVRTDYGRLDAVVNNAGAAAVGTVEMTPMTVYRDAMEVNYFGVVNVTRSALPLLRESRGRLVTVSSVGGVVGQPFNEAYCAAKFAVEGFIESLGPVAQTVGVRVTIVEPGAVRSEFVTNAGMDPEEMLASAGDYRPALAAYLERTAQQFDANTAQTPEEAAAVIVDVLDQEQPALRVQTSAGATAFVSTKITDLDGARVTAMTDQWVDSSAS